MTHLVMPTVTHYYRLILYDYLCNFRSLIHAIEAQWVSCLWSFISCHSEDDFSLVLNIPFAIILFLGWVCFSFLHEKVCLWWVSAWTHYFWIKRRTDKSAWVADWIAFHRTVTVFLNLGIIFHDIFKTDISIHVTEFQHGLVLKKNSEFLHNNWLG